MKLSRTLALLVLLSSLFVAAWVAANTGFGSGSSIEATLAGARAVGIADIDADGDGDVVVAAGGADTIAWYENDGNGTAWSRRNIDANVSDAWALAIGDVNGDALIDVAAAV